MGVGLFKASMKICAIYILPSFSKDKMQENIFSSSTNATRFLNPIRVIPETTRVTILLLHVLLSLKGNKISLKKQKKQILVLYAI